MFLVRTIAEAAEQLGAFHELHGVQCLGGNHHPRLRFAEEQGIQTDIVKGGQIHLRAEQTRRITGNQLADGAFRQRDRQTAIAAIMRALDDAGLDQPQQRGVQGFGRIQIATGWRPGLLAMNHL